MKVLGAAVLAPPSQLAPPPSPPPRVLPNNTLIVDLSKCHSNLIHIRKNYIKSEKKLYLNSKQPRINNNDNDDINNKTNNKNNDIKRSCRREVKFEMPEALLRARVKLKSEDYDKALCVLTNDFRYQLHLFLYGRVQSLWLLLSTIVCMFIPFVFMTPEVSILAISCALWLLLQLIGGLATFAMRKRLNRILERAVAQVNSYFMDHNLMLGVINFGGIFTKSKLMVPLVYFDTTPCRLQIESTLSGLVGAKPAEAKISQDKSLALAKSQLAKKIVLKYSQRWISQYDRRKLLFSADEDDSVEPRHLSTGKCICQFFEAASSIRASTQLNEPDLYQHQPEQQQQHQQLQNQPLVDPSGKQQHIQQMGFNLFALISSP